MRPVSRRRRSISRNKTPIHRKQLWFEQLEDRVVPTVIDLTQAGAPPGTFNGAVFYQFTQSLSGAGITNSLVRIASNQAIEQGYNTNFRPVQFDESTNAANTQAVQLSTVPTVISSGGLAYYEFLLDINQLSSSPLLSVDELRFYVTNSSTVDPTLLHNYNLTTHTLQDDGGQVYSPVYDMNPTTPASNYIELNASLASGASAGDMVALIPVTVLGTDLNQYVYLYSKLGVHLGNNDGYEQWYSANALPLGSISGKAFVDTNGNSMLDPGEPGKSGITVFLDANNNGILDPGEVSTVTAADGSFSFSRLLPGTYQVREVVPAGYVQTDPINNGPATVTVVGGQNTPGVVFGNFQLGSISGTKFEDVTGNGFSADDPILNSSNPDFVPVTMQLLQGGAVVATTTTGNDGTYTFSGIGPGTLGPGPLPEPYTVAEVKPNGWIQTATSSGPITPTSGFAATDNFDNYRVAQVLSNNVLAVRTTQTGTDPTKYNLSVVQDASNMIDITVTLNNISQSAGSFPVAGLVNVTVTTFGGFTIDTSQVTTLPVVTVVQGGNNNFVGGSSGSTVNLNSGGADSLSVAGGQNTLNFSPTNFGVTFNAGINSGQSQALDSTGQHSLSVKGNFQTIDGTNFSDTLTAALPTFNPITGFVSAGTTIFSGLGKDTIFGTLATKAQTDGSGSQYTEVLSPSAVTELQSAIQTLGTNPNALAGFEASVTTNGGSTGVITSILTNVTLNGSQNQFTETVDAAALQVLQAAQSFGAPAPPSGGGFGVQVTSHGNSFLTASLVTNATLLGTGNSFVQTLDNNSLKLLEGSFGAPAPPSGGGFGVQVTSSGNSFIQASVDTTATLNGTGNQFVQTLDNNSLTLLEASFGAPAPPSGGGFGVQVTSSGNSFIQASVDTTATLTGTGNQFLQTLDNNSLKLLEASFGAPAPPSGGGFGVQVTSSGNSFIQASVDTTATLNGSGNTFVQTLDNNSLKLLEASFGAPAPPSGGGFGVQVTSSGNSFIQASVDTTATLHGTGNQFLQTLDNNSLALLEASFGAPAPPSGGGFGVQVTSSGNSFIQASVDTNATLNGSGNTFLQTLDNNSLKLLEASFGAPAPPSGGGFGVQVTSSGNSFIVASVMTSVTLNGNSNKFVQSLDNNSLVLLDAGFGAPAPPSGGGFGDTVVANSSSNSITASVLTNVTLNQTFNAVMQTLDPNSLQLLNNAFAFGGSSAAGGLKVKINDTMGNNSVQTGLFGQVQLSGSFDTYVEQLTQGEVNLANTILTSASSGGQTAVNAAAANIGPHVVLGNGDDVIVGGLLGTFQAGIGNDRFVIEDPLLLGASSVTALLLEFGGSFTGGGGNNTFYLVGSQLGHVAINEPTTNNDTIDLSSIQATGPSLDLSTSAEQVLLPGQAWLTLSSPGGTATVIGNGNGVTLKAGNRNVTLEGAAPLDDRAANPPAWQGPPQIVFLDFNTFTTGTKHVYNSQEQGEILSQLQTDYAAFPFVQFTLQQPGGQPASPSNPYETLFINKTPTGGEPGGHADELDFRNLNLITSAAIDVNGLLGGAGQPAATSADYVALTATICAHELGHTLGLLHIDSFGPIGFNIHNPPGGGQFVPTDPGPAAAWETHNHIIASPAAVGSSLFDATNNPFFGEREAIKLAFIQGGTTVNEQAAPHGSIATAQSLTLVGLQVPNTVLQGFNAGKILSVAAVDVTNASIQIDPNTGHSESDYYSFVGRAGDLINIQALSGAISRITDPVDTLLRVYDSTGHLLSYYGGLAVNDDTFEPNDAMIEDLKLPTDGTYYVEVDSFAAGPGDPQFDPHNPLYNPNAANDTETGHYELFIYRFQAGNTTPVGGSNSTFIVGPGQDTILGRGGHDTVKDSGAANYVLTNTSLTGTGAATLQGITTAVLTGAAGGSTFDLSGWTGTATVIGVGGTNTLIVNRDVSIFTLTNNTLTLSDGTVVNLVNIQKVMLTGGPSVNSFDLSAWTTGTAVLDGGGGINTVIASRTATSFILTNSSLTISGGGTINLANIQNAVLTGAASGTTFDVRNWSGTDTLNSLGGSNLVVTPRGVAVNATEGVATAIATANFTDAGTTPATNYTASIDWGDSTAPSAGAASASGSAETVKGSHPYKDEGGTFTVTTTFSQGTLFSVIVNSTAKVVDAPLTASSSPLTLAQGLSVPTTKLATFTDANTLAPISDFTATITWGDGSSSMGLVTQPGGVGTTFVVSAGHAYGVAGTFTVTVKIADVGGQAASTSFTVTVQPSIIVLNPSISGAMTLTGKVAISIAGAVLIDSSSATALSASGTSQITAGTTIQVVGGVSASNGAILSPTPITGIKPFSDPLAGLTPPTGSGTNLGTISLTKGSLTINPGTYAQISVSGTGTTLTMNPGIYIITGGGFSVSNSSNVNGAGVMIYNAGSNFPNTGGTGVTYGAISLGSSGKINLSAPTTGPYAGVLIFQSRDNTRALSLSASSVVGVSGTIYAPSALLSLGGSATLMTSAIVGQLDLNGSGGSALTAAGTDNTTAAAGQLLGNDLFLYVNDPTGLFNADEMARLADTITGLDALLAPYSVTITEVTDSSLANLILDTGSASAAGGLADGVLGCYVSDGVTGEITLIQGWNWYTGADPTLVGSNQYDFQTILTHEMGHALGLGHNINPDSVMHAELPTGVAHRTMTVQDLNIPDLGVGPDGLHAAPRPLDEIRDVSRAAPRNGNEFAWSEAVDPSSTVMPQSSKGFGFTLADFSAAALPAADYRSEGFATSAFKAPGVAWRSEPILLVGLGLTSQAPAFQLEDTATIAAAAASASISPRQAMEFRQSIDPYRVDQSANHPILLDPRPLADGPWESLPISPLEVDSTPIIHSGSLGTGLWELDESWGWLLLGMFLIPSSEVQREMELRSPGWQERGRAMGST